MVRVDAGLGHTLVLATSYVPALVILAVCLVSPIQQWVRWYARQRMNRVVLRQVALVEAVQHRLRCWWLDIIMHVTAASVSIEFYITVMPILYMLGWRDMVAVAVSGLAMSTCIGCALKDVFCAVRPTHAAAVRTRINSIASEMQQSCLSKVHDGISKVIADEPESSQESTSARSTQPIKPITSTTDVFSIEAAADLNNSHGTLVVVEDNGDEIEYGSPSLHVLLALIINGTASHVLLNGFSNPSSPLALPVPPGSFQSQGNLDTTTEWWQPVLAHSLTASWAVFIALNRLYLGVHSPLDCCLGLAVGVALLLAWNNIASLWLVWMVQGGYWSVALQCAAHVLALSLYPRPAQYTTSYRNAATFLGAHIGLCMGIANGTQPTRWSMALYRGIAQQLAGRDGTRQMPWPLTALLAHAIGRQVGMVAAGLTVTGIALVGAKAVLVPVLPRLLDCVPWVVRRLWQPPVSMQYGKLDARPIEWLLGPGMAGGIGKSTDGNTMTVALNGSNGGVDSMTGGGLLNGNVEATPAKNGKSRVDSALNYDFEGPVNDVLRRPNGYPCDADTLRRYIGYSLPVWAMVEYTHVIEHVRAHGTG